MLQNKKRFIIPLFSSLITGIICSTIVYGIMSESLKITDSDLYGTYVINSSNSKNMDHLQYLAVMPPINSTNEKPSTFQWYTINNDILEEGTCDINLNLNEGFINFSVDEKNIACLFNIHGNYYFIDKSIKPQKIEKISEAPIVVGNQ